MQWIDVKKDLPKDDEQVLAVMIMQNSSFRVVQCTFNRSRGWNVSLFDNNYLGVKFWMTIPEIPQIS